MYPFARMISELIRHRNAPPLAPTGTHVSHHRCWPWDIDMWLELNNGRTLTLYDLGRTVLAVRTGLAGALRQKRWGLTMAGVSVRYRRRIRTFERFEMRSRLVCWDDRFLYVEQSMWKPDDECAGHVLYRSAVIGKGGIVPPKDVALALRLSPVSPDIPEWIAAWIAADAQRPWPPMQD